jgi:site-specific recombinase XerD
MGAKIARGEILSPDHSQHVERLVPAHHHGSLPMSHQHSAAANALQDAVDLEHDRHLAEERAGKLATATVSFYKRKLDVVLDVLGGETPLLGITSATIDQYIATRLEDGAADHTIAKEMIALKGALTNACSA